MISKSFLIMIFTLFMSISFPANSDFYDFLHTTPEGSKRIGNLLAKKIIESSLIDKL